MEESENSWDQGAIYSIQPRNQARRHANVYNVGRLHELSRNNVLGQQTQVRVDAIRHTG